MSFPACKSLQPCSAPKVGKHFCRDGDVKKTYPCLRFSASSIDRHDWQRCALGQLPGAIQTAQCLTTFDAMCRSRDKIFKITVGTGTFCKKRLRKLLFKGKYTVPTALCRCPFISIPKTRHFGAKVADYGCAGCKMLPRKKNKSKQLYHMKKGWRLLEENCATVDLKFLTIFPMWRFWIW